MAAVMLGSALLHHALAPVDDSSGAAEPRPPQKVLAKHRRSATQVVEPMRPRVPTHCRCRSHEEHDRLTVGPPQDIWMLLSRFQAAGASSHKPPCAVVIERETIHTLPRGGVATCGTDDVRWMGTSDEMLLLIMQLLPLEDVVSFCIASAHSHDLRVWLVARLRFKLDLDGMALECASASSRTEAASATLQSTQEVFRERSSLRELYLEDVRAYEGNQTRYELNLLEMYNNEEAASVKQQAATAQMQSALAHWDTEVARKTKMENFFIAFSEKVLRLCTVSWGPKLLNGAVEATTTPSLGQGVPY